MDVEILTAAFNPLAIIWLTLATIILVAAFNGMVYAAPPNEATFKPLVNISNNLYIFLT